MSSTATQSNKRKAEEELQLDAEKRVKNLENTKDSTIIFSYSKNTTLTHGSGSSSDLDPRRIMFKTVLNTLVELKKGLLIHEKEEIGASKAELLHWGDELDKWKVKLWDMYLDPSKKFQLDDKGQLAAGRQGAYLGTLDGMMDQVT